MQAILPLSIQSTTSRSARVAQSYQVQYISLILIILTFVIGSFGARAWLEKDKPKQLPRMQPQLHQISALQFPALFTKGQASLLSTELDSVATLLLSHDLYARLEIFADVEELNGAHRAALALARAELVFSRLRALKVPSEAFLISASEAHSTAQLKVAVFRKEQ